MNQGAKFLISKGYYTILSPSQIKFQKLKFIICCNHSIPEYQLDVTLYIKFHSTEKLFAY